MNPTRSLTFLATIAILSLPAGCSDDNSTQPSRQPALDRMWPNEDGRYWSFDLTQRWWGVEVPYTLSATPIALPAMRQLAQLAAARETPDGTTMTTGTLRLEFDGTLTIYPGVTGQNLVETITFDERPLRTAPDQINDFEVLSLALHGGVWEKSADRITGYGDAGRMYLPWTYLESELTTGHEFVQPLGNTGATLRARVLGPSLVETPAGIYTQAIEVFYVIDFGVSSETDGPGNLLGYMHPLSYGSIHYAPGVGPVASYERMLSNFGPNGLERGYAELRYSLRSTGITP